MIELLRTFLFQYCQWILSVIAVGYSVLVPLYWNSAVIIQMARADCFTVQSEER